MKPFSINIDPDIISDLKARIARTKWPDETDNGKWQMGTSKEYLQDLCDYWKDGFDWYKQQEQLNTFAHYKTDVGGFDLHFIHEKGKAEKRIPLLLIHGWPDSFYRFYKLIGLLTEADAEGISFDVVVPSIPGYGFTGSTESGVDAKRIAAVFNKLMKDKLGYDKYYVHGGDWGGTIGEKLALYHAAHIKGLHLTDVPFAHSMQEPEDITDEEKQFFKKIQRWRQTEGAYAMIQATKPQSLAYGLTDSPAGLAGWILEKFHTWSDNGGDIESAFSRDELLTNITLYWVTASINSANRLYYEEMQSIMAAQYNPLVKLNPFDKTGDRVEVPVGFAVFPKDISPPPQDFARRFFNVVRWKEMPSGGHFAALEEPERLAKEIREFAGKGEV